MTNAPKVTEYVTLDEHLKRRPVDRSAVDSAKVALLAEVRAYKLSELRKEYDFTQVELATRLGISQTRVSAIEHGDILKTEVGTLAAFVTPLGGELEVVVTFGNERVVLT